MTRNLILLTFVLSITNIALFPDTFHSEYNHSSGKRIKKIAIIGDRVSGTVCTLTLLKKNFLDVDVSCQKPWYKHDYPWLELSEFKIPLLDTSLKEMQNEILNTLENCEDTLFIYLVRGPYKSLSMTYMFYSEEGESFENWLSVPLDSSTVNYSLATEELTNPYTEKYFQNHAEIRNFKILNSIQLSKHVSNFLFVQYEQLIKKPNAFIKYIVQNYKIDKNDSFKPVHFFKQDLLRINFAVNKHNLQNQTKILINDNVQWDTEHLIGYEKEIIPEN